MKKVVLFVVFLAVSALLFAQPSVSEDWLSHSPVDDDLYLYHIGMSEPCESEKEAYDSARRNLISAFAASVSTLYTGNFSEFSLEEGFESDALDSYTLSIAKESWKSEVPLSGVRILDRQIRKDSDNLFIAYVLGYMTRDDFSKARIAVSDEETSALAYSFFEGHARDFAAKESGTFNRWLKSHCLIIEIASDDAAQWQKKADEYVTKLFRAISTYPCTLGEKRAVVIYNTPDYSRTIIKNLSSLSCLETKQDGSTVLVSGTSSSFGEFSKIVSDMKNPSKIAVFGSDCYTLDSGNVITSAESRAARNFRELAQKNLGFTAVSFARNFTSYDEMKDYFQNHKPEISARYLVFCSAETGIEDFGKKSWINADVFFTLYDLESGEEYVSSSVTSMPMSAVLTARTDDAVISKSRAAVDNACNPDKNPESLLVVMQEIFNQLP